MSSSLDSPYHPGTVAHAVGFLWNVLLSLWWQGYHLNEWSRSLILMHCFSLRSWIGWDTTYSFAATETSGTEENLHECESRTCMYWQAEKETEAKGAWRWDTKNNKELK